MGKPERHVAALILITIAAATTAPEARAYTQGQFESVTTEEQSQVNRVRDQEIAQLKIVLGRRFSENRRPDILLRLAELYIEKYRFYFFKENEIHQGQYKSGLKPKHVDHVKSREYLRSATAACLAILKSRVSFAKLDEVYYFLGYNAEEMGNRREAVKYFAVVAHRFPSSAYAPEAFRNLAEASFEAGKFAKAVEYYERAAQFTKVPSYPRTLYKLAWGYFKTRRRAEALSTMKRVIEVAGKEDKFVGLRDEALGDIVLFFSEAGRLNEAESYFSGISGGAEVYSRALTKLSKIYEARGDKRLAMRVNEQLVKQYGDKRPDLIYETLGRDVELYRKAGDGAGEERALQKLVDFFAAHRGELVKGEEGEATYARAKNYLRGRATEVHKEARTKKSNKQFSRAADLYTLYIKAFLQDPKDDKEARELTEIRTYRADALLAAGREGDALPELERTLSENGDAKLRREAGATLLNILIKRVDSARKAGKSDANAEKQFLKSSQLFEDAFPDDKLVAELRYKRARLLAGKSGPEGLNSDARSALEELIEKYPSRAESADAARELVEDLKKRGKEEDAVARAKLYLANGTLTGADKSGELGKYLRKVIERQEFTDVTKIEKDNDYGKAAQGYERLAESARDPEVAYKSLNNAAVNYDRAGQVDEAVRVYSRLAAKFPANHQPREELKRLAGGLLWKSRYSEAARLFARLSGLDAYSHGERLSFARTSLALSWGTGDLSTGFVNGMKAERELCGGTVRKGKRPPTKHSKVIGNGAERAASARSDSGDPESCNELALDLARIQIEAGRTQEAAGFLKSYAARGSAGVRKAEANFMLGSLYQQFHEPRKAGMHYEEASRAVGRSSGRRGGSQDRERNFAAHAAFLLIEPYFAQFSALKIELPEERLKAVVRKKLSDLESLVTRYSNVVAYGDGEWGIAALERLYDLFSSFAGQLDAAPVPPKYQGAMLEAYKRGIQGNTQPMQAKALEYLRQGYQKGLQLGVTTPTFIALTQRLSRRSPREYPPAHYSMVVDRESTARQSALKLSGAVQEADAEDLKKQDHPWRAQVASKLAQNPKSADTWVEFGNIEALGGRLRLARLLYEQAVSLNPKSAAALCNLSVVLFLENRPVDATQGLGRAAEIAEFSKDIKLNLAKALLAFHHFAPALDQVRALAARYPQDHEAQEAVAVAQLGSGQLPQATAKLQELDAEGSKRFTLWYNWSVAALLGGSAEQKEKARDLLKDRREGLAPLEKAQTDVALSIGGTK